MDFAAATHSTRLREFVACRDYVAGTFVKLNSELQHCRFVGTVFGVTLSCQLTASNCYARLRRRPLHLQWASCTSKADTVPLTDGRTRHARSPQQNYGCAADGGGV